jgi:hypothetical protein
MKCRICNQKINTRNKSELRGLVSITSYNETLEKVIRVEYEHHYCRYRTDPNIDIKSAKKWVLNGFED